MRGTEPAHAKLYALQASVRRLTGGQSYVSVTEYGSIALADQPNYPTWSGSMTDALYMMSSLSLITNSGVPWAEGGALTSGGYVAGSARARTSSSRPQGAAWKPFAR